MLTRLILVFGCTLLISYTNAQQTILLYPSGIPNSKANTVKEIVTENNRGWLDYEKVVTPDIAVYSPAKPNGTAVIVVPGGGYKHLAYTKEGTAVAKALNQYGITALVLKYRHPLDSTMTDKSIGPVQDLQQVIVYARMNAEKLKINPQKIGVLGFSAGGHLASTALTHFENNYLPWPAEVSVRPDFGGLIYPVINLSNEYMHAGSRNSLLGENPSDSAIQAFSNDLRVTTHTPPVFLVHAIDDNVVKIENSIRFQRALKKYDVPNDIFIYKTGGHGFGLQNNTDPALWFPAFIQFIQSQGF